MIEPVRDQRVRERMLAAMRAVLSDDNNHERGQAALRDVVDQIAREGGRSGLCNFAVGLSLELAGVFERIASERGLAAADLAEVWLAD